MTAEFNNKLRENFDLLRFMNHSQNQPADFAEEEDQNDGSRNYDCKYPDCGKSFRYRSEIMRHIVTHTNDRHFVCPDPNCRKGFKRSDALATHIRIHTGEKPFQCSANSCQLSFSTKAGLRYHLLKHKNDKVFRCDYPGCDQSFLTKPQLKQHKRGAKVHDTLLSSKVRTPERSSNSESTGQDMSLGDTTNSRQSSFSKYESPIQKRVQLDQFKPAAALASSQQIQQISIIGVNLQTIHSEKLEPSAAFTSLLPFEAQPKHVTDANAELFSNLRAIETPEKLNRLVQRETKESFEDIPLGRAPLENQTQLLKSINKMLDENASLKKNLELCQKIIRLYQANVGAKDIYQLANCNSLNN